MGMISSTWSGGATYSLFCFSPKQTGCFGQESESSGFLFYSPGCSFSPCPQRIGSLASSRGVVRRCEGCMVKIRIGSKQGFRFPRRFRRWMGLGPWWFFEVLIFPQLLVIPTLIGGKQEKEFAANGEDTVTHSLLWFRQEVKLESGSQRVRTSRPYPFLPLKRLNGVPLHGRCPPKRTFI